MGRISIGHHRRVLLGQMLDAQGDPVYPDEEPGEAETEFSDFTETDAPPEQPEEEEAVPQSVGRLGLLPSIIQEVPRIRRIGVISVQGVSPAVLVGGGAAGLAVTLVGGFFLIREIPHASAPIAKVGIAAGLILAGLLGLHSTLAISSGLASSAAA